MGAFTILPPVRIAWEPPNPELPEDTRARGEYHATPSEPFTDVGTAALVPKVFAAGSPLCGQQVELAAVPDEDAPFGPVVTCRWCQFHLRRLRLRVESVPAGSVSFERFNRDAPRKPGREMAPADSLRDR